MDCADMVRRLADAERTLRRTELQLQINLRDSHPYKIMAFVTINWSLDTKTVASGKTPEECFAGLDRYIADRMEAHRDAA